MFGNLEGPISDVGEDVGSIYSFRQNPKLIEGLRFAGFDILSFANNHVFDWGRVAFEDTMKRLKEAGIEYVGAGFSREEALSPKIIKIKGLKIAFLAFSNIGEKFWEAGENSSGIAWLDKENLEYAISKAKPEADILIISMHFGDEYKDQPNADQKYFAKLAIDLGANLVIGHHPHVVQLIEKYKDSYIAYSLGNFIFDQNFSKETMQGLFLEVAIKDGQIKDIIPRKIKINNFFQPEIVNEQFE
jgi:poly-gamma-glutamate synthesis protein (capsule biosynthesis protein)